MKGLYTLLRFGRLSVRPVHAISLDNPKLALRPHPVPAPTAAPAAALSRHAAVSVRTSSFHADGVALAHRPAGGAAMGRSRRHIALAAALGGGGRRWEILQPSRRRLGCAARRDR